MLSLYCRLQALKNERGATAVEYGIMVALIAAAIAGTVYTLGQTLDGTFTDVNSQLGSATGL